MVAERDDSKWIGKPFINVFHGKREKHYKGVIVGGQEYYIQDSVSMINEQKKSWLAKIEHLKNGKYQEKVMLVRWYYTPEQTKYGRHESHQNKEIFESSHLTVEFVWNIKHMITVETESNYQDFLKLCSSEISCNTYFTRSRYICETGEFRPIMRLTNLVTSDFKFQDSKSKEIFEDDIKILSPPPSPLTNGASKAIKRKRTDSLQVNENELKQNPKKTWAKTLKNACARLALSSIPAHLPCREAEYDELYNFLLEKVKTGGMGASVEGMYLFGMPGTGKTATVHHVISELKKKCHTHNLPDFQFVEINGMKLPSPQFAYSQFWAALDISNTVESPEVARKLLMKYFSIVDTCRTMCILLLDEIDYMLSSRQDVLYNFFGWPGQPYSRFVVVGISNTIDVPERLLPKVYSRLGMKQILFQPYEYPQLQTILTSRLRGIDIFDEFAIELASRKVAGVSGDVRRALQLCRRAGELCEIEFRRGGNDSKENVTVGPQHIERAYAELFQKPEMFFFRNLSFYQKLFICSMAVLQKILNVTKVPFLEVCQHLTRICNVKGFSPIPDTSNLLQLAYQLEQITLLVISTKSDRLLDFKVCFPNSAYTADIHEAFRDDPLASDLLRSIRTSDEKINNDGMEDLPIL